MVKQIHHHARSNVNDVWDKVFQKKKIVRDLVGSPPYCIAGFPLANCIETGYTRLLLKPTH